MPDSQNQMIIPLKLVEREVLVDDMNYKFYYKQIFLPNEVYGKLFILHYKEAQQTNWFTSKNLLSEEFSVAKTELVIDAIHSNLGGEVSNASRYRSHTSVKATFCLSGYDITAADDSDADMILFKLITNLDSGTSVLATNKLSFNVINGFSGNHALQLSFGILKIMNKDDMLIPVNNIFLLDEYTVRLIHNSSLNVSITDVTNVQSNISNVINKYRLVPFSDSDLTNMVDKFPKKFMNRVSAMISEIPIEIRNFYYISYILSACLHQENKVELEIRLRSYISALVNARYMQMTIDQH